MRHLDKLRPVAKAIAAALGSAGVALYFALSDDVVTAQEWVAVGLGLLGVGGATYGVPNRAPDTDAP